MRARLLALLVLAVAVLAPAGAAQAQTAAALRSQLAHAFRGAGAASGAYVQDVDTGEVLFSARADAGRIPASVEKLYTTSTAILRLGAATRLETTVTGSGFKDPDGVWQGDLYLRGGGDPTLSSTGLRSLARQVFQSGVVRVEGRVLGDESLFDRRRGGPRTGWAYDRDLGGVLGALTVSRGWSKRHDGPASEAARRFAAALKREGIRVEDGTGAAVTPPGTRPLATVRSPTIAAIARATLVPSDNFYADTLLKDLGAYAGGTGTTTAGVSVVRDQLAAFRLRPTIADGSGLSRVNRTSPRQVVGLLRAMHAQPEGPAFESALAVAGRTGTVRRRMRGTAAQDRCRTKTGTLRDVSALAGLCTTTGGRTISFAFLMNRMTATWRAHAVQDRMTALLARYDGA